MKDKIKYCVITLNLDRSLDRRVETKDLRGAVASHYPEYTLLHQHSEDGKLNYNTPLVQYKIHDKKCLIIGIEDGAELLTNLKLLGKTLFLGNANYNILTIELEANYVSIKTTEKVQFYSFLSPWLALNEANYDKYQRMDGWEVRKKFLEKILVGNIISMSKSLGYTVPEPIKVDIGKLKEVKTKLKGTPMLGFLGSFSVNFEIPDYWGIGKSVSRGFGTVKRTKSNGQN